MDRGPGSRRAGPLASALAGAAVTLASARGGLASAAERWDVLGGTLTATGQLGAGAAARTSPRSPALLPGPNAAALGASSSVPYGRNSDDGDLNFAQGDLVSAPVKAALALDLDAGPWGAQLGGFAWYDHVLETVDRPWGNVVDGYAAGRPLGDGGFAPRARFSGAALGDANLRATADLAGVSVLGKLGWQLVPWGVPTAFGGGLAAINPDDLVAARRPGATPDDAKVTFPAVFTRVALGRVVDVEAFYQLWHAENVLPGCGTYFSGADYFAEGCRGIFVGPGSDRTALATGNVIARDATRHAPDSGELGVGLTRTIEALRTRLGLYFARYHSRQPFAAVVKSARASGAPFVALDPDGLNPRYFTTYPAGIQVLALNAVTRADELTVSGELTWRPNQPIALNQNDAVGAFVSTAPALLRADEQATPPGGVFPAWDRHGVGQATLGAQRRLPRLPWSEAVVLGGEVGAKWVPHLPRAADRRYGRADFGTGPVSGAACAGGALTCSNDGFVSAFSWGYRVRAAASFRPGEAVRLAPSVAFGHDVRGWSYDGNLLEGRMTATVALRAEYGRTFTEVAWSPIWGGDYNALKDRSWAAAFMGARL